MYGDVRTLRTFPALLNILKCRGEKKKSFNIPPQSSPWVPNVQSTYPTVGIWQCAHFAFGSVQNHNLFRLSTSGEKERDGGGGVSTSEARKETAAAVSDAITPRISISPLMSITLGRADELPAFFLTGKLSKCNVLERGYRRSSKYWILLNKRGTV